jgi:hypothetical protein
MFREALPEDVAEPPPTLQVLRQITAQVSLNERLMLSRNVWPDRRVVPAQWVEQSTSTAIDVGEIRQYGYH